MREGLTMFHELDFRFFLPLMGTMLAELEAEAGRVEAGLTTLDAQVATIEQTGERWFHAEVHRARGELLLKREPPNTEAAEAAFNLATEIARSQQTRTFELRGALSLAKLYEATGRDEAARELLGPTVAGFTEEFELPEVAEANRLLVSLDQIISGTVA